MYPVKTQVVLFNNSREHPPTDLLHWTRLKWIKSAKYLGVQYDTNLDWKTQTVNKKKSPGSIRIPLPLNRKKEQTWQTKQTDYIQTLHRTYYDIRCPSMGDNHPPEPASPPRSGKPHTKNHTGRPLVWQEHHTTQRRRTTITYKLHLCLEHQPLHQSRHLSKPQATHKYPRDQTQQQWREDQDSPTDKPKWKPQQL